MRLNRADDLLNDAILALDQRLVLARRSAPKATPEEQRRIAWSNLSSAELSFITGEITRCANDRRYYLQNYHVIQPEVGILTCINPLYAHQEIVEEALTACIARDGWAYIIILKPRQSGMTEYCNGVICWRTFFLPHATSISVAQDPRRASHIQRKITIAYRHLPWWLQSEQLYGTKGDYIELGRKSGDDLGDAGLGSVFITTHAQTTSGTAIGLTIRTAHLSEISRWPNGEVWTADIEPSMNAPDRMAFAESTAFGNDTFQYYLWEEASKGDSDWTPVFLAAYRAKKYSLPIKPSQQPFQLTEIEAAFTERVRTEERFEIAPEFWNWRRKRINASISRTGFPYAHLESYPITPQEAFQSSGSSAFPRHKLDEQQMQNVRKPEWVGEVLYQGKEAIPKRLLNHMIDDSGHYRMDVALEKRELTDRLYVWEQPLPGEAYYAASDVGDGIFGGDFSVVEIFRAGYGTEPDYQVAEWVGYEAPLAFAKIIYALGWWYNRCEVAVEYAREGMACANALTTDLEYPNLYRPRRPDKATGSQLTTWFHWQTTQKTKPYLLTRMTESLLENTIVIRSQYLIDELRRCVKEGISFAGMGGHDDAAVAACIAHYCMRETMPELRREQGAATNPSSASSALARALHPPLGSVIFGVYDPLFRLRAQRRDLAAAEELVAKNPGFLIRPIRVSKANTAYSPIYHGQGLARELLLAGVQDREITPDLLQLYGAATGRDELSVALGRARQTDGLGEDGEAMWDSTMGDFGG